MCTRIRFNIYLLDIISYHTILHKEGGTSQCAFNVQGGAKEASDAGQTVWPRIKSYDVTVWVFSINKLQGAKALHRYLKWEIVGGR